MPRSPGWKPVEGGRYSPGCPQHGMAECRIGGKQRLAARFTRAAPTRPAAIRFLLARQVFAPDRRRWHRPSANRHPAPPTRRLQRMQRRALAAASSSDGGRPSGGLQASSLAWKLGAAGRQGTPRGVAADLLAEHARSAPPSATTPNRSGTPRQLQGLGRRAGAPSTLTLHRRPLPASSIDPSNPSGPAAGRASRHTEPQRWSPCGRDALAHIVGIIERGNGLERERGCL